MVGTIEPPMKTWVKERSSNGLTVIPQLWQGVANVLYGTTAGPTAGGAPILCCMDHRLTGHIGRQRRSGVVAVGPEKLFSSSLC